MRALATALLLGAATLGLSAAPARAQTLNDVGRLLQDQVLGSRPDPNANRDAYEQGRRDAMEEQRRRDDYRRNAARPDDRRRADDAMRRQHDEDAARRRWADDQGSWADQQRRAPGRY